MAKKMLKRDFVGRQARLLRRIENGRGEILDAGEIVKIDGTYRGRFSITTVTICGSCYRRKRVGISQVHESAFELVAEDEAKPPKPKKPHVALVSSAAGDWAGIYVNGVLLDQGHSVSPWMVLQALGIEHDQLEVKMDPYEMSSLPEKLADLPKGGSVHIDTVCEVMTE